MQIKTNFYNDAKTVLMDIYFPNVKHHTDNKKAAAMAYALELFNNGCLSFDKLVKKLRTITRANPFTLSKILLTYIEATPEEVKDIKTAFTSHIVIIDNNGATLDRYTILNKKTGDILSASDNPFHPCGVGQHCGNVVDNYMHISYGYSWRKHCNVKACIKEEVERYLSDLGTLGSPIPFDKAPADVQTFAVQQF